ncbi:hypothetical protein J3F84DRAFT_362699 [Trichoderma pleuroticola]
MRAESAPERWLPSINGTGAFLLGPVLLSCVCALRQWPKFMIACICAPGRIMHAEQRSNESPPCDTTAPAMWAPSVRCYSFANASDDGTAVSAFPTNCSPRRRRHALTHSSQPAFTSPPSPDLLILRGRTHWYGYGQGHGAHMRRRTRLASRVAAVCAIEAGCRYVCMYVCTILREQQRHCCLSTAWQSRPGIYKYAIV